MFKKYTLFLSYCNADSDLMDFIEHLIDNSEYKNYVDKKYGWYMLLEKSFLSLMTVGTGADTLEIVDDAVIWNSYVAYDMDSK